MHKFQYGGRQSIGTPGCTTALLHVHARGTDLVRTAAAAGLLQFLVRPPRKSLQDLSTTGAC